MHDLDDILDVEPGEVTVPQANAALVRLLLRIPLALFALAYIWEYYQEYYNIKQLKAATSVTEQCLHAPQYNWSMRMIMQLSGVGDAQQRECEEQRRILAMVSLPNPLIVVVNLVWRSLAGHNAWLTMTRVLSQQSYVVQVTLIVVAGAVIGLVAYRLILRAQAALGYLIMYRERSLHTTYQLKQSELRKQFARNGNMWITPARVYPQAYSRRHKSSTPRPGQLVLTPGQGPE